MQASPVHRRRRLTALLALGLAALAVSAAALGSCGDGDGGEPASGAAPAKPAAKPLELPRGGRRLFPDRRIVSFYGAPQADELGELGIGSPSKMARRLVRQARPYGRKTRPVLPAMELIAVIAANAPGDDGLWRTRQEDEVIRRYLRAARRAKALLILDIQPGRADFFTETVRLRKWLKEPDVGLAIDPEWRMKPGEVPGDVIGSVASREVNATTAWLAQLVERHRLPEKLFLIHQFTNDMVEDAELKPRRGLAMVLNADGFGSQEVKTSKYRAFTASPREFLHQGYKLFYREDQDLMTPKEVLRLRPPPDVVIYE